MIIFDLDGTLALINHRRHFVEKEPKDWYSFFAACVDDEPNVAAINVFRALINSGHKVVIWSGRSDQVRTETEAWVEKYVAMGIDIMMRKAGDHQPDVALKKKWLDDVRDLGGEVSLVFDDRDRLVEMWRSEGVPCFQVEYGNF